MSSQETEIEVRLPRPCLAPGHYYCGVAIGRGDHRSGHVDYDVVLDTLSFEVRPEEGESGTVSKWTKGWGAVVFSELMVRAVAVG